MSPHDVSCELVSERDLDTRYLSGRLSPEEAEAFEAHFFGCERCWGLVGQGLAVRSGFQEYEAPIAAPPRPGHWRRTSRRWWGLAAAAGIAAVALGVWRLDQSPDSYPEDTLRGGAAPFVVGAGVDGSSLTAAWPRLAEADLYRVRLYFADGRLALERETSDTFLSVPMDADQSLTAQMLWQVQALDRLRNPVARSDLTRAVLPRR